MKSVVEEDPLSASAFRRRGVSQRPGAIALTRAPVPAHSGARERVVATPRPLEARYALGWGSGMTPPIDAMLTIEPRPCASILRPIAWLVKYVPLRLSARM